MSSTATRTLTPSLNSPVVRSPAAQTANGDYIVQAHGFTSSAYLPFGGSGPRAQVLVAERGFSQALPVVTSPLVGWVGALRSLALGGHYCVAWPSQCLECIVWLWKT